MRAYLRALCLLSSSLFVVAAWAQDSAPCDSLFEQGETAFYDGAFDETIRLLRPCVAPGAPSVGAPVYRLLSMAYLNQGNTDRARQTIVQLLQAVPGYEPDLVQDPPSYTVLVLGIREQLQKDALLPEAPEEPEPNRRRGAWLGVGAGLIIIGLTAIFAGG